MDPDPDPGPTPKPIPFFSDFKDAKINKKFLWGFLITYPQVFSLKGTG